MSDFPNFLDTQIVDKDGKLTNQWRDFFSKWLIVMRKDYGNGSTKIAAQPSDVISTYDVEDTTERFVHNKTTNELLYNPDGLGWKKVGLTPVTL